jgi:hypothetical protein
MLGGAVTVTDTVCDALPPTPLHVRLYWLEAVRFVRACVPETFFPPLQAPDAVQLVAFAEDHVSVAPPPDTTEEAFVLSVTVGCGTVAGGAATVTLTLFATASADPVHVRVKLVDFTIPWISADPDVACDPLQPSLAVQEDAFVDDQVRVTAPPLEGRVDVETLKASVGGTG